MISMEYGDARAPERWWSKIYPEPTTGCWLWSGTQEKGYGRARHLNKRWLVHRFMYEAAHGPIPEGLEPDHLCRVRACVNPGHLEAVTHAVNMRRTCRETCDQGHRYPEWKPRMLRRECPVCRQIRRATPDQVDKKRERDRVRARRAA